MFLTNPLRRLVGARRFRPSRTFHVRCGDRVSERDNFLSRSECDRCVRAARRYQKFHERAVTIANEHNAGTMAFCGRDIRDVTKKLDDYVFDTYGMTSCSDTHVNVYEPDEVFEYHHDALDEKHIDAFGPQRIATVIVYLNTVNEGGETVFPDIDESVVPVEGRLVFWENVDEHGNIDLDMGHLTNASPEYRYVLVKMFHHVI